MSEVFQVAEEVAESHIVARRFIFAYLFFLMIKFFKAFGCSESSLLAGKETMAIHACITDDIWWLASEAFAIKFVGTVPRCNA